MPDGKYTGPPACRDVLMGTCKWGNYCSYNHNIEVLTRTYFDEYGLDNMMPLEHKQQIIREANGKGAGRRGPLHEWDLMQQQMREQQQHQLRGAANIPGAASGSGQNLRPREPDRPTQGQHQPQPPAANLTRRPATQQQGDEGKVKESYRPTHYKNLKECARLRYGVH